MGAAFLFTTLSTQQNAFSTPESDYELSHLPISNFEKSQVITVDSPQPLTPEPQFVTTTIAPLTIINTETVHINGDDYVLITYSDLSTQLIPLQQYETEIHVSVEDSNNDDNHHSHHNHSHHSDNQWTQSDFDKKYGNSLPDNGQKDDDDNGNTEHPNYSNDHNTDVKSTPSSHDTSDNNNIDSGSDNNDSSDNSDSSSSDSNDSSSSSSDNSGDSGSDSGSD